MATEKNNKKHWLSFKDIIDLKDWQKIQDGFSLVTGVCLRTLDTQGNPLTLPSNEPRLCSELKSNLSISRKICEKCLPTFLGGKGVVDRNLSYHCMHGVCNFVAPLRINNKFEPLGYLILGPLILVMRKHKEEYRKIAEELNVDLESLWSAIVEMKVASFQGAQSMVELIKEVGEYTLKLAYKNAMREREFIMSVELPKLGKFLDALLDVAFQISGADIGSIMFFDKTKNELIIRSSKGIPEEIVRNARVKLGFGISGIAAEEGRPLLIDDNTGDNRIRPYLNRPNLSSSMVLPLKVENRVVGVMNLGALKTSVARFNADNLNLMNKLADMASVAMTQ